jgi:uncharacterized protein YbbK (DUF523 family)/uncharacterized protein YbgA (DUF1722 family)
MADEKLKIGISQCLLGSRVRYDGSHKANAYVMVVLAPHFEWVPVCPEVEAGMGVPREPVKLQASDQGLKMAGTGSGTDYTDALNEFAVRRIEELADAGLSGYILKSGSPSCGLEVQADGSEESVKGMFAEALTKALPSIPMIEETLLADPGTRQLWVEQVFAYSRLMQFMSKPRSVGQLAMAHAQAKLQLEAHVAGSYEDIAGLFQQASSLSYQELCDRYLARFMEVMQKPATIAQHFATFKQIFEAIKSELEPAVVKELARTLQDYRQSVLPLSVPLMLLRHYVRVQENGLLDGQTYLEPGPRELLLRTQL